MIAERMARSGALRVGVLPAGMLAAAMVAATLGLAPAADATTIVTSSLTVSGPVTAPCAAPSATINAPAGSTVRFSTSLIGPTTAPITNLLLAPAVEVVLNPGAGNQVVKVISYAPNAPRTVDVSVPSSGRVHFAYVAGSANAQAGGLLGGVLNLTSQLTGSFRARTGLSAGVTATWTGQIVVGSASNGCSVQPQVPAVVVSPTVPKLSVPPVRVPGVTPPAVPVPRAGQLPVVGPVVGAVVDGVLGAVGSSPTGSSVAGSPLAGVIGLAGSTGAGPPSGSTDAPVAGAGQTASTGGFVANSRGSGPGPGSSGRSAIQDAQLTASGDAVLGGQSDGAAGVFAPGGAGGSIAKPAARSGSPKIVEIASSRDRSVRTVLPTFLVVLSVLSLSMATACYARTFLLRRSVGGEPSSLR
jgi:hypothetical protein